ncbi:hypothetical protein AVEN_85762-1 [Araneus ventricosus]|uniref:Uncharacterized protein n=1 Tax=Araneus ventricosus TaxID=182803 RepID=A0A4Y2N2G8_ARAVE|nr:hypothetical protein AVEN_85762-1 [Araneus ventricosus]
MFHQILSLSLLHQKATLEHYYKFEKSIAIIYDRVGKGIWEIFLKILPIQLSFPESKTLQPVYRAQLQSSMHAPERRYPEISSVFAYEERIYLKCSFLVKKTKRNGNTLRDILFQ